jgi:hypothetical protein
LGEEDEKKVLKAGRKVGSARSNIRRRRHTKSDKIGKKLGALMFSFLKYFFALSPS